MICKPTNKEAGVTFIDGFMHQLHSEHVATDFPLVKAAPATSIQGKGNNCKNSGVLVPQLGRTLLPSYLCSLWESREISQSPKSIFIREDAHLHKTSLIFSALLFCDSFC